MEQETSRAAAILDGINVYGDVERPCIEAAIRANHYLHHLDRGSLQSKPYGNGKKHAILLRRGIFLRFPTIELYGKW